MEMTPELWAALDKIDEKPLVLAELEMIQTECRWQAENHPKTECRAIFKGAAERTSMTRKEACLIAGLAYVDAREIMARPRLKKIMSKEKNDR